MSNKTAPYKKGNNKKLQKREFVLKYPETLAGTRFFKLRVATEAGTRCQGKNTNSQTTEALPGAQGQSVSQRMCPGGARHQFISQLHEV